MARKAMSDGKLILSAISVGAVLAVLVVWIFVMTVTINV